MAAICPRLTMLSSLLLLILLLLSVSAIAHERPSIGNPLIKTEAQEGLEKRGRCQYVVEVKTGCRPFAGTNDPVSLVFGDEVGNQVYLPRLDDPSKDTFERCQTDSFSIVGPCVYDVCYLYLYRHGSDDWRVKYVKVYYGATLNQVATFKYDSYIPEDKWFGFDVCNSVDAHEQPQLLHLPIDRASS